VRKAKNKAPRKKQVGSAEQTPEQTETAKKDRSTPAEEPAPVAKTKRGFCEAEQKFPKIADHPHCSRCGKELDPFRAQVTGKARGSWRCNRCNCRAVQMSRLSSWKELKDSFKDFTPEQAQAFWQEVGEAEGTKQLERIVETTMRTRKGSSKESSKGGKYLPLGVYKAKGFDTDRIEKYCTDFKDDDPVLGRCYKVRLEGDMDKSFEGTEFDKEYSKKGKQEQEKDNTGQGQEQDEDSGEDSDSSSSSKKAKKNNKNNKKDKEKDTKNKREKEKQKQEQKERKEKEKAEKAAKAKATKEKNDATKILSKLISPTCLLENELKQKLVSRLPTFALEQAKATLDTLVAIKKNAEDCIKKGSELQYTIEEVGAAVTAGQKQQAFVSTMLAAAMAAS